MRILFLGTSDFAVPVLDALLASDAEVACVVSAPDRPKGRGRRLEPSPVARLARDAGVPLHQPPRINDPGSVEILARTRPDLTVVVAYGQILGDGVLGLAPRGTVNLHASLLPHLRGAAPIARGIQRGDAMGGVTLQYVVRELDAGDVIAQAPSPFGPDETAGEASERLSRVAAELLLEHLPALADGTAPRTPQDHSRATYAPRIRKEEGRISWSRPAADVRNHIRAMTPWPTAFNDVDVTSGRSERLIFLAAEAVPCPERVPAGTVLRSDTEFVISCEGGDALRILRLKRAGRAEMDAGSFLRGFKVPRGTVLR